MRPILLPAISLPEPVEVSKAQTSRWPDDKPVTLVCQQLATKA
jgi:hypothetical protein